MEEFTNPDAHTLIYLPRNTEGYWAEFILRRHYNPYEIEVIYTDKFPIGKNYADEIPGQIINTIVFGLPMQENQAEAAKEKFGVFADLPFLTYTHIASYGYTLDPERYGHHILEEQSPLAYMVENLYLVHRDKDEDVKPLETDELAHAIAHVAHEYHSYQEDSKYKIPYLLLADHFKEDLHKHLASQEKLRSFGDIVTQNKALLERLEANMNDYLRKRVNTVRTSYFGATGVVGVVYAEQYRNEVAHRLITLFKQKKEKVIILVGNHTRGDDHYSIRTHNVHAGELAQALNYGGGKENTASVFLPEYTTNLAGQLTQFLEEQESMV